MVLVITQLTMEWQSSSHVRYLTLFDSIVNSRWFVGTKILLLFTKVDLFEAKLPTSPMTTYFPDYRGSSFDEAKDYVRERFVSLNHNESKNIDVHFLCQWNQAQMRSFLDEIEDEVFKPE